MTGSAGCTAALSDSVEQVALAFAQSPVGANRPAAGRERSFSTMFVQGGASGVSLPSDVYDFTERYGRIATLDQQSFRGEAFTTVFGQNSSDALIKVRRFGSKSVDPFRNVAFEVAWAQRRARQRRSLRWYTDLAPKKIRHRICTEGCRRIRRNCKRARRAIFNEAAVSDLL